MARSTEPMRHDPSFDAFLSAARSPRRPIDPDVELLESERCFLRGDSPCIGAAGAARAMFEQLAAFEKKHSVSGYGKLSSHPKSCWHHPRSGAHDACAALPYAARATLMSRATATAAAVPDGSHLRDAMERLGSSSVLVFFGDSASHQLAIAAACELQRSSGAANNSSTLRLLHLDTLHRRLLPRVLQAARQAGGAFVVVSIGLHYNDDAWGGSDGDSGGDRLRLARDAAALAHELDEFVESCDHERRQEQRRCAAMMLTPPSQHFPTSDGSWSKAGLIGERFHAGDDSYGCRELAGVNESAPSAWRATEVERAARATRHLLTLPYHELTRSWWDAHLGRSERKWLGDLRKRTARNASGQALDCTHFCAGPYLFEPVWWAVKRVVQTL